MSKKSHLFYTTLLSLSLIMVGCSEKTENNKSNWKDIYEGQQLEAEFNTINVKTDVFSIYVDESPDQEIHMEIKNADLNDLEKNFNIAITQSSDKLDIEIKGKHKVNLDALNLNKLFGTDLHLKLPTQDYKEISLKSDVGTISYSKIATDELEVTNSVGQIIMQDIEAGKTKIKNEVGPIKINANQMNNDIDVATELGNIEILLNEAPQNMKLNLSTELGRVDSNLDIVNESKSSRKITGEKGSNGSELKVRSSIGNISVNAN